MAKTTKIGDLRAELTLDSKKFDTGIDKSRKKLGQINKGFGALKTALAGILSAGLLVKFTKDALSFADAIGKSADRIGITTTKLQELRFAFDRAGVSTEGVDKALLTFGKRLGKAKDDFGALTGGLKNTDAELLKNVKSSKSMEEAVEKIFRAMGKATTQTQRLAIADAAFGKAGLEMTAAFQDGNRAFEESIRLFKRLGIAIDEDLIRNAEATNDKLSALGQVLKTKFFSVLLQSAPLIGKIADGMISMAESAQKFVGKFDQSVLSVEQTKQKIIELRKEIAALEAETPILPILGFQRDFKLKGAKKDLAGLESQLKVRQGGAVKPTVSSGLSEAEKEFNAGKTFEKVGAGVDSATESMDGFFKSAAMVSGQRGPLSEIERRAKAIKDASVTDIQAIEIEMQKVRDVFNSPENMLSGGEFLNPDGFQVRMVQLNEQLEEAKENAKEFDIELVNFTQGIANSAGNLIFNLVADSKNALSSLKDFALNISTDILGAFVKGSFVDPLAKAGKDLFEGFKFSDLFNVFSSSPAFASGGSFEVGGKGGIDQNLVAFRATKGERVTIETQSQQRAGEGGGVTVVQNITIQPGISQTVRAEMIGLLPAFKEEAKRAVLEAKRRGGSFGQAFA